MLYFPNSDVAAERAAPAVKWPAHIEPEDCDTPELRVTLAQSPEDLYYMVSGLRRARPDAGTPCAS